MVRIIITVHNRKRFVVLKVVCFNVEAANTRQNGYLLAFMTSVYLLWRKPFMPTTDGLEDIVATHSHICDLDGKLGKLTYYGVDIHDLARHSSFEETAYLLWHGVLPTQAQLAEVKTQLQANRSLPGRVIELMRLLPTATMPMDVLRTTVSVLSAFDPDAGDRSSDANHRRAIRLTAQFPTIITSWNHIRNGREPVIPLPDESHA